MKGMLGSSKAQDSSTPFRKESSRKAPKLIFLDIDGTLTPAGSNDIPSSALEAIAKTRRLGNKVFLCTGRNAGMLKPVYDYGCFDGAVACAGGYVYTKDEVLFDCPMSEGQFKTAMKLLRENDVLCTIESRDEAFGDEGLESMLNKGGAANSELVRWRKVLADRLNIKPMRQYDASPVYKIVFMCERIEQIEPVRKAMEKDFNFVVQDLVGQHGCYNGELINRRFDKGKGVEMVAERFGIPLSDTYGFGDSMNDLEMILKVGTSVCMENGSSLLKEKSDFICPSVEDDGIEKAFEQLGLI